MSKPERRGRRWLIGGRVQGVGFRWFAARRATALGLGGWATNLPDGRVEVVAAGSDGALEELGMALAQGPRLSRVDHVESDEYPHEMNIGNTFDIK